LAKNAFTEGDALPSSSVVAVICFARLVVTIAASGHRWNAQRRRPGEPVAFDRRNAV
jgi:hypothetical protein